MDPDELDSGDTTSKFSDFFIFHAVIGKGAFGVVVSALSRSDNKEYAIKVIRKQHVPPKDWDRLRQEAMIHVELNHKNIVGFKYIKETENRIFLVMELVKGGQLKDLINARFQSGRGFTDEEVSLIMKSIFSAVKHFHAKDIVHRDLKPENILVQDWEDLTSIKIADFGLSTQFSIDGFVRSLRQKCGTMIYMAPELALEEQYGKPVDIWSCGLVMYILLSNGNHPLYVKQDTPDTFIEKLKNPQWTFGENFSQLAENFFRKIMSRNPIARYTADEVEKHPWLSRRFDDEIPLSAHEVMNSFSLEQSFTRIMKALYVTSDFIHKEVGSTLTPEYKHLINEHSEEQQRKKNIKKSRLPRQSNMSDYDSLQSLLGITTNSLYSPKNFPGSPIRDTTKSTLTFTKETRTTTLNTDKDYIKTSESIDKSPLATTTKSQNEEAKFFKESSPTALKKEEDGLRSPDRNRFRIKSTSSTKALETLPYTDFINQNPALSNNIPTSPLKSKSLMSNKSDTSNHKITTSAMQGESMDSPSTMKTEPEDENDDSLSEIKNIIGQSSNTTRERSLTSKAFLLKNIHTDAGFESDNVLGNTKKHLDDSFNNNSKSVRSPSVNIAKGSKFDNSNNTSYATDDSNESGNDNPRSLSSKELLKFPKKSPFYHSSVKPPSPMTSMSTKNSKLGTFNPKTFSFVTMTPSARKKHNESREFILPPITPTPTQKKRGKYTKEEGG